MPLALTLTLLAAAHADPPEPPDPSALLERAKSGVAAIPGCFVMRGEASDAWNAGLFGKGARTVSLGGSLEDGLWDHYYSEWRSGKPLGEKETRGSMFGRFPRPETADDQDSTARVSLEALLEDEVAIDYVEPEGAGWKVIHTLKGGEAARNQLTVHFDASLRPWRWTIDLVDEVKVQGDRGKGKIDHLMIDLVSGPDGAPVSERMDGKFRSWPFVAEVQSSVVWTHTVCPHLLVPADTPAPVSSPVQPDPR